MDDNVISFINEFEKKLREERLRIMRKIVLDSPNMKIATFVKLIKSEHLEDVKISDIFLL